jgi:hypothetical protein
MKSLASMLAPFATVMTSAVSPVRRRDLPVRGVLHRPMSKPPDGPPPENTIVDTCPPDLTPAPASQRAQL